MSKHTPGPWKAVANTHFHSGLTYVSVQPETPDAGTMRPLLMASGEYHVCRMTHTAAQHAIALHVANARLIAAAPELLEALKACAAILPRYRLMGRTLGDDEEHSAVMETVEAAISKASAEALSQRTEEAGE